MILRRPALAGLLLCSAVLAATYPFLLGLDAYPRGIFLGEDTYAITPAGGGPLTEALAGSLRLQPWAIAVSPEVYAFSAWSGTPVVVRGVDFPHFLAVTGATLEPADVPQGSGFALLGSAFAARAGLSLGSPGILTGSTTPALVPVTATAILHVDGPIADEVVLPLATARPLTVLSGESVNAIRVRTGDPAALEAFLQETGEAVAITGPSATTYVNAAPADGGRLGGLVFLYPEVRTALDRSFLATFAQQGMNGVRVVVVALLVLVGLLAIAGIDAIVWRATAEASRPIGILRAVGARPRTVVRLLLGELLSGGAVAILAGVALGHAIAALAGAYGVFLLFAHEVRPAFDPVLAVVLALTLFAIAAGSGLVRAYEATRRSPRDLLADVPPRAPAEEAAEP